MSEIRVLDINDIRLDGGTQPREEIDYELVNEYTEHVSGLPPVEVYYDGANYWLVDGFHRWYAHKNANVDQITADVHNGSLRDAVLYSVGANASHGKRRTNADKRKAVFTLLKDGEWSKWSDREIAKKCLAGHSFVSNCRSEIPLSTVDSDNTKYKTKHGTISTMKTSNIGKSAKKAKNEPKTTPYVAPYEEQGPQFTEETGDLFEDNKSPTTIKKAFTHNMQIVEDIRNNIIVLDDSDEDYIDALDMVIDICNELKQKY
jgi:hypothetical protein